MKAKRKLTIVGKAELATTPRTMNEKLQDAIDWLGPRWRLHKDHDPKSLRVNVLSEWRATQRKSKPLTA